MPELKKGAEPTPAQAIRAQAREASRRALLEAGLVETIARGGEIPSVDAIVARAGFTRGAFYFYFEDRNEFLLEMLNWVITDIFTVLLRGRGEAENEAVDLAGVIDRFNLAMSKGEWPDVGGDVRTAYLAVLRHLGAFPRLRERHNELMTGVIAALTEIVRSGQSTGELRDDVDPAHVANIIFLAGVGEVILDRVGIPFDQPELGKTLFKLVQGQTSRTRRRNSKTQRAKMPLRSN